MGDQRRCDGLLTSAGQAGWSARRRQVVSPRLPCQLPAPPPHCKTTRAGSRRRRRRRRLIPLAFGARCRHYLRSAAIGRAEARRRHDLLAAQRVDTSATTQTALPAVLCFGL